MALDSQSFWQQFPSRLWQISLQLSSRGPGHRCAIATATMRPERGNARRCANCPSMRIAGGQRLVTKKVLQRRQWRRTIQIRTRKRRIALNRLASRSACQLSADSPNFKFLKNQNGAVNRRPETPGTPISRLASVKTRQSGDWRSRKEEPCGQLLLFPMTSFMSIAYPRKFETVLG